MNKFTKRALHKQLALAGMLGVSTFALQNQAKADVTFYTADATKTSISTVGLAQTYLGNSILLAPSTLATGVNEFKYAAVNFTPTESGVYKFGQTYSVNDTIMILYQGIYDPTAPGAGALVGNDDTLASIHRNDIGAPSTMPISCFTENYCPQVTYDVVAGMTYTLFVSVYRPTYNDTFTLPFDFYSTGDVIFGIHTGRSPIDLARSNYMSSELGVTVDPIFVGGTLHMDENNGVYAQDFTLSNMASSTIDQYNNYSTFNGQFTDGVAGTPGQITINNSGTDGEVTFNGVNTYTGSTTLKGGTLAVSQDANLGDTAATLIFDGGKLRVTDNFESMRDVSLVSTGTISVDGGKAVSLAGVVSGAGSWAKDGEGALILNANNTYTGATNVAAGTLVIGSDVAHSSAAISGGGNVSVAEQAILGGYGSVSGNVTNSGTIAAGSAINGTSADTTGNFTINGNYAGNNGILLLNSALGDDASVTDKLVITGNATGTTKVSINNIGGLGAKTVEGMEVVDVGGVSDRGAFVQNGRIVAGAYDYSLVKGNATGSDGESWFLSSVSSVTPTNPADKTVKPAVQSPVLRPEAGGYLGLIEHNQSAFNHSFHDRQQLLNNEYQSSWARTEYTQSKSKAGAGNELGNKTNRTLVHFGSDVYSKDALHLGVMGGYSKGEVDTSSSRNGNTTSSDSDGYSVGVYGTWFDQGNDKGGLYVDGYAQYNWFDNSLQGSGLEAEKFKTNGKTLSAEAGYGIALGKTNNMSWMIEPQVQVIYNSYDGKDHTEKNGTRVQSGGSNGVASRVGVRLQGKSETVQPFVTLNYWTHGDQASISMNDTDVSSNRAKNVAELKVGGQIKVNKNVDLFGQLQASAGSHSTSSYGGNVGVKVNW